MRTLITICRSSPSHFEVYVSLWAMCWGLVVLGPGTSLIMQPVYEPLRKLALGADPDLVWGTVALLLGIVQLSVYWRYARLIGGRGGAFNFAAWRAWTLRVALVWWSWLGSLLVLGRPASTVGWGHLLAAAFIAVALYRAAAVRHDDS
jgi:hypothetical protein